jgi:hypothetical protein
VLLYFVVANISIVFLLAQCKKVLILEKYLDLNKKIILVSFPNAVMREQDERGKLIQAEKKGEKKREIEIVKKRKKET